MGIGQKVMVTSPYKWKLLEWDVNPRTNKQKQKTPNYRTIPPSHHHHCSIVIAILRHRSIKLKPRYFFFKNVTETKIRIQWCTNSLSNIFASHVSDSITLSKAWLAKTAFKRDIRRIHSTGQGSVTQSEIKIFNVNGLNANDFQIIWNLLLTG